MHVEPLPVDAVLDRVRRALAQARAAVLVAPPGAGKTTRVPLALLDEPWLGGRKVLVLEPRRLAARAAAERMAETLGERLGATVGLRARLDTKVGPRTSIEVVTEGVFTRMILDDPALEGVGAVLFDEFHERSLDADLGLALTLDSARALRTDLRLLVMSATIEGARVADLLGAAPLIEAEGRSHAVETRYVGRDPAARIEARMADVILKVLASDRGSILAFLPGQREIHGVVERLRDRLDPGVVLAPLYGAMDAQAQRRAIAPAPPGRRKVVLATSIAETSLTIEGIRLVVDSGLARVPVYEPGAGLTRLVTTRASRASADQRRGRAGRTEPGVCYRLWEEAQTASLPAFAEPEIRNADLSGLLLACAEWGVTDPATLSWLDPPPQPALAVARTQLVGMGALDEEGRITPFGRRLQSLPLPPRLAGMVLVAAERGEAQAAAEIAALLVERGLGGSDVDLAHRLATFRREDSRRAEDMRRMARTWARAAASGTQSPAARGQGSPGALLALAYPERIARARAEPGQFLLANGRGAFLDPADPLARSKFLAVAELQGAAAAQRILLAAAIEESDILDIAGSRIENVDELFFDAAAEGVRARSVRRLGAIEIAARTRPVAADEETARVLALGIAAMGVDKLPWSRAQLQLRQRVAFLRASEPAVWPDLSDAALGARTGEWLLPFLAGKTRLADITADDLARALDCLLPPHLRQRLAVEAPTHFEAPTGVRHPIDYEAPGAPVLRIRVQELFGLKTHPTIAAGRLPLTLHLLSPAERPIQITRDLPGFWSGSWSAVKAEMKGRYPKHAWPNDPANAAPTTRAKPRVL